MATIPLNKSEEFDKRLKDTERDVKDLKNQGAKLKYPLTPDGDAAVGLAITQQVPPQLYSFFWDNVYYYSTNFESNLDRFTKATLSGVGSAYINTQGLNLNPGTASIGDYEIVDLITSGNTFLSLDRPSRFRTSVKINSDTQLDNSVAYILGCVHITSSSSGYGFKTNNATLFGLAIKDGVETQVTLTTAFPNNTFTQLEARYLPGDRVIFFVNGKQVGVVTSGLPARATVPETIFYFEIRNQETADQKILTTESFEFIQQKAVT